MDVLLIHLFSIFFTCQVANQPIVTEYLLVSLDAGRKKKKFSAKFLWKDRYIHMHIHKYIKNMLMEAGYIFRDR